MKKNMIATKRYKKSQKGASFLCVIVFFAAAYLSAPSVKASFVMIGGTGVAADTNGFGGVNYVYQISRYEVTGAQFAAAAAADSRVGTSYTSNTPDSPVENVSWYEAAKYCNWLTSGSAYLGAYLFDGSGTYLGVNRSTAISIYGIVYALPTENEWYKAAYWTGNADDPWSLYAHGLDTLPTWGTTDGWNYWYDGQYAYGGITWEVGTGAQEQNGTYDMMGNVWEWMESPGSGFSRVFRGGGLNGYELKMSSAYSEGEDASQGHETLGFRIVVIPEPGTALLFFLGGIGAWLLRRNRMKSMETEK